MKIIITSLISILVIGCILIMFYEGRAEAKKKFDVICLDGVAYYHEDSTWFKVGWLAPKFDSRSHVVLCKHKSK